MPRLEPVRARWWRRPSLVQTGWITPPISSLELGEWEAFERLQGPILVHERVDLAGAIVSAVLASVMGDGKRRHKVSDFLPRWAPQTVEEQMAIARAITQHYREGP